MSYIKFQHKLKECVDSPKFIKDVNCFKYTGQIERLSSDRNPLNVIPKAVITKTLTAKTILMKSRYAEKVNIPTMQLYRKHQHHIRVCSNC